jgi:transglutaminase-like putative cysteine protease
VQQTPARAQEHQFLTEYDIIYSIQPNGETFVTQRVTITNLENDVIATSYTITINNLEVYDISATSAGEEIDVNSKSEDHETTLTANFKEYIIGEGRQNSLTLNYKSRDIASQIGEIWNINIPKTELSTTTTLYNIRVEVPHAFGPKIYLSPEPTVTEGEENKNTYYFVKESIEDIGITASFGKYQQLNFKLKYQLENPYLLPSNYEIAFPSDIHFVQQVSYSFIEPAPKDIYIDEDGNSIAIYRIGGKKTKEVEIIGSARITGRQINPSLGGSFENIPEELMEYTAAQKYWEVNSEPVQRLANDLRDENLNVTQNAFKVYDYVIKTLDYDFDIINETYVDRKGAESALLQRGAWACMEFTDLFIATARAMGIPARELNGYAFAGTDKLKPLSISFRGGDLLHAWPEFYDPNFGWIQIDPTWGKTSGIDYFTKLDTNHFAFVTKGMDSEYPAPAGAYRFNTEEKLVEVELSQETNDSDFETRIGIYKRLSLNPFKILTGKRKFEIVNEGKVFVYDVYGENLAPKESLKVYLPLKNPEVKFKDMNGKEIIKSLEAEKE